MQCMYVDLDMNYRYFLGRQLLLSVYNSFFFFFNLDLDLDLDQLAVLIYSCLNISVEGKERRKRK